MKFFQHENLFWTILLPEWVVAICAEKFHRTREQIIEMIRIEDMASFESGDLDLTG